MTSDLAEHEPAAEVQRPYIIYDVDPRTVRAGDNVRYVGNIRETRPELVASVARHGLDPLISIVNVAPDPDGVLKVLVGSHRHAAAVAVKERENPALGVPLMVHPPGTTRRDVKVAQGIENLLREGFTQAEEACYYEQLALEGFDDDEIARELAQPVERVRAGRAIAASPRSQATSEAMPDIDLLSLAVLAEFADDETDHQKLTDLLANRPYQLESEMDRIRRRRSRDAAKELEQQRLEDLGYAIIGNQFDLPKGTAPLAELCTGADEAPLEPGEHADCPGRAVAVVVGYDLDIELIECCSNYAEHGHRTIVSAKIAAVEAQLRADDVPIIDAWTDGVTLLRDLFTDGQTEQAITLTEHAACPGHAAYVEADPYDLSTRTNYVCTGPAAHGHVVRGAKPELSAAFKKGEYDRTRANNAEWRDRKPERRALLAEYFNGWRTWKPPAPARQRTKTAAAKGKASTHKQLLPPRVHHLLALAPILAPDFLKDAFPQHSYACTLLKLDQPTGKTGDANPIAVLLRKKTTTETQAHIIHLAQVIGACEQHWDHSHTDNADSSWRSPSPDARFYFELLEALGIELSHVEQLFNNPGLDQAKWPHLAPEPEIAEQVSEEPESADVTDETAASDAATPISAA